MTPTPGGLCAGLWVLLCGVSSVGADRTASPLPSCGVAAVYAVLKDRGQDVSVAQVEQRAGARAGVRNVQELSLADLRLVLEDFGVSAVSLSTTAAGLTELGRPAILYLRPERLPDAPTVGHFMVCRRIERNGVELLDLGRSYSSWQIPLAELDEWWDGECLVVASGQWDARWLTWQRPWLAGFATASGLLYLYLLFGRRGNSRTVRDAAPLLGLLLCGCTEPPGLRFETTRHDGGTVSAGETVHATFRFTVTGDRPLTIRGVATSCDCMSANQSLIGQVLEPGSQHLLRLAVNTDHRHGAVAGTATITTEPLLAVPIRLLVSAVAASRPRVLQGLPVRVASRLGESAPFRVSVENHRGMHSPPLMWDERRSDLSVFGQRDYDATEAAMSPQGAGQERHIRELHRWTFITPSSLPLGEHAFTIALAWNDETALDVPVVVVIEHPVRLSLERVFLGELPPGEKRSIRVGVRSSLPLEESDLQITTTSNGPELAAEYLPSQSALQIGAAGSGELGRFQGEVTITSTSSSWPPIVLPVSGIISSGGRSTAATSPNSAISSATEQHE